MAEAARVPGRGWYLFAGAVALAGVLAMVALIAWYVLTLEQGVQFLGPGRHTLKLDRPGKFLVWNDYQTVFHGRSYDESEKLPPGARISVFDKAGGRALTVTSSRGGTSTIGNTSSVAVSQFEIEQPGSYEIVVEGDVPQRVFSVGRDFIPGLFGVIAGAFALIFGGFGAATGIAAWAFIRREEALSRVQPAASNAGQPVAPSEQSLKNLTAIVYGLQLASFLVGFTIIAAIIVNYVKRRDVEGTWLESHFRWQIRTFWYSLLWLGVGLATAIVLIGFFVLMASAVWLLYRAIKGWIALEERRPMYS